MSTPDAPDPDDARSRSTSARCCDQVAEAPKRTRVTALMAMFVGVCAGCCALPLLVPVSLFSGAVSAVAAATGLFIASAVLFGVAGLFWFLHYHRIMRGRLTGHACPYC